MRLAIPAALAGALCAGAVTAHAQVETEVKVERERPPKEKHVTLRFLKENREFIRQRLDLLRQKTVEKHGDAAAIDPRYLDYQRMLAEILAGRDTVAAAEDARRRQQLLESISQLGSLEAQLDVVERLLAEQHRRLATLQENFTTDQHTALLVVVSGYPSDVAVNEIAVTLEDGATLRAPLTPEQQESLRHGGIVEVFHGFVEPREQVVEVSVSGAPWPSGDSGFVTLEPARDRITLLKLDLSAVHPDQGGPGIHASTWLHDDEIRSGG
jgi:hypothetical protein